MVNFDLGERFPRPRSQQRGSLRPRALRVAMLGMGAGGGRPLPVKGSGGAIPENFFEIFDAKSLVWGQFGPENKLIEGHPNEYDVICRNASVLACHHLWPTIFAGTPFRLQNICRNGVPPRSRTTTPLLRTEWRGLCVLGNAAAPIEVHRECRQVSQLGKHLRTQVLHISRLHPYIPSNHHHHRLFAQIN